MNHVRTGNNTVLKMPVDPGNRQCDYFTGIITGSGNGRWMIDDTLTAVRAAGCLLVPETGDYVCYLSDPRQGKVFILSVLSRQTSGRACLDVPDAETVRLQGKQIDVHASRGVRISTLGDMDLMAGTGTLSVIADQLFQSVSGTLVQTARHLIAKAKHYALNVSGVLQQNGEQQIITANKDVRIDGERINMG